MHLVQKIGAYLAMIGFAIFIAIFVVVLVNGTWPPFLNPIKELYGTIGNFAGDAAIIVEAWLFVGPGAVLYFLGSKLAGRG